MKLLKENILETLKTIGIYKDFSENIPEAQAIKGKIGTWVYIQGRSICTAKETFNKEADWEKIFASYASDTRMKRFSV